ncbi:MAG: response regulator [Colwellia sp.]|nr:response regulator [Colwellia sp.]
MLILSRFKYFFLSFFFLISTSVFSSACYGIDFIDAGPVFNNIEKIGQYDMANITHIMQDGQGFIWLINDAGLLRFDGNEIKAFPALSRINGSSVISLVEGQAGRLWITTTEKNKGLWLFDSKSEKLEFIDINEKLVIKSVNKIDYEPLSELAYKNGLLYLVSKNKLLVVDEKDLTLQQEILLPIADNDAVIRLTVTDNGDIWYASQQGKGVSRIGEKGIQNYKHQSADETSISAELVLNIFEDSKGRLWFSSPAGLDLFLPESDSFKHYLPFDLSKDSNKHLGVRANVLLNVVEDAQGYLWLALFNSGIARFQPETKSFKYYHHTNGVDTSILTNSLYWGGAFLDRQQTLWVLTKKGISKLSHTSSGIQLWTNLDKDSCSPKKMHQTKMALLFGCNKSLYQIKDNKVSLIKNFAHRIFSIYQADNGFIWLGTVGGGIYRYDLSTDSTKNYQLNNAANGPNTTNTIERIRADVNGDLYGIVQKHAENNGSGIIHYQPLTDEFSNFATDIKLTEFIDLSETRMLLISSYTSEQNKLHWFTKKSQTIEPLPIATGLVYAAVKWQKQLWLSTEKLGLISINPLTGQWQQLATQTTERISGFYLNAKADTLYLNIDKQLYQFIAISNDKINTRCISCILPLNSPQITDQHFGQMKDNYALLMSNGEFIVAEDNNLITFPVIAEVTPQLVSQVSEQPNSQLLLTDYKVMGKSISPDDTNDYALLKQSIGQTQHLIIPPETTLLSFSFARVGASHPEQVQYAYKMVGLNSNWIYVDANRSEAIFSLLPAGQYSFLVKSTDDMGHWRSNIEPLSLKISVLPPWWQTWWAYCFYLSCTLFLLWLFYRVKISENARQSAHELALVKEKLFANLSHEFRTPLTLILGPANVIKSACDDKHIQHNAKLIERNAQRLLSMVDQLLQLAQLKEPQHAPTTARQVSVSCHFVMQAFDVIAIEKKITLKLNNPIDDSWWVADSNNSLETILYNLLINAIKFTKSGGLISLNVEQQQQMIVFSVADNGCGIPAHEQENIFARFTRLDNDQAYTPGAGIGLALVKELVITLGGKITVSSKLEQGSTFTFNLPQVSPAAWDSATAIADNSALDLQQKIEEISLMAMKATTEDVDRTIAEENLPVDALQLSKQEGETKPMVLIVDDNQEMREFIRDKLATDYLIVEAEHGQHGLQMAEEYSPDLIISDVMMPRMDGFQLLAAIRNNMAICHIPVILLTAKDDQKTKLRALSDLADDYITKPFKPEELSLRIQRLLGIRAILQRGFSATIAPIEGSELQDAGQQAQAEQSIMEKNDNDILTEKDQLFALKFKECIAQGYQNPNLSLSIVATQLAMSERQLQRKVKAIAGISFSEILRDYRLSQGQRLLKNGEQIAVIADQVGFGSSSYFVRCFKAKFGTTPNDYRKKTTC